MENTTPYPPFKDVKVFAGDNFYAAADANYKNLIWENKGKKELLICFAVLHKKFSKALQSNISI